MEEPIKIPINLQECFHSLNMLVGEEDKEYFKNLTDKDEIINFHFTVGMWIRNNWGLWKENQPESILKEYFEARGVYHPDSISTMILEFYYDWLNNENDAWQKFDKL